MLNQSIYKDIRGSYQGSDGDVPPDLPGFRPGDEGVDDYYVPSELSHSENGRIIYSEGCGVVLWTWWDFDQSGDQNTSPLPIAYINGKIVCGGHTTLHIIAYRIERSRVYGSKASVTIYVKMNMGPNESENGNWNGGAKCTHRIWGGGDGETAGFFNADPDHRCEKSGTCGGGATFKVVFDTNSGTYRIS